MVRRARRALPGLRRGSDRSQPRLDRWGAHRWSSGCRAVRGRDEGAGAVRCGPCAASREIASVLSNLIELDTSTRNSGGRSSTSVRRAGHGRRSGLDARKRKSWCSVGLRRPAPILASSMARRPPASIRNSRPRGISTLRTAVSASRCRREPSTRLPVSWRARSPSPSAGRTAGGLTKFEPTDMERLLVPDLPELNERESPTER